MITDNDSSLLTAVPAFDFDSYLLRLTGHQWTIQELSGGNANHTVRAVRKNVRGGPGKDARGHDGTVYKLDDHASIVVKQAPPYFVKFPDMPFSQNRQTIEARALSLWHASSDSETVATLSSTLSSVLHSNPSIRIPHLLHHDLSTHVLIQSDLGMHPPLNTFLASSNTTPALAASAGAHLGCFLKDLHAAFDNASEHTKKELGSIFTNNEGETVLCGVIGNTVGFMMDAGVKDHIALGRRALDNWTRREKTAFGQGDIWFGTVLVGVQDGEVQMGICDWEFAGFNHPAGDIAQLGSYLHLSFMSPLTTPSSQTNLQAFSSAFYSSYIPPSPLSTFAKAEFQRSLVLMHAWELINAAAWRHYLWCSCPGEGVKCDHIIGMIKIGARLLSAAGEVEADGKIHEVDWEALRDIGWCRFLKIN